MGFVLMILSEQVCGHAFKFTKCLFFKSGFSRQRAAKVLSQALTHLPGTSKRRGINTFYLVITCSKCRQ